MTGIRVEKFSGHFVSAPVARDIVFCCSLGVPLGGFKQDRGWGGVALREGKLPHEA